MSIQTKNGERIVFTIENGVEALAPLNCDVYVHITDNSNGTHSVHGKVRKPKIEDRPKEELAFHRGKAIVFASNEPELFAKAHQAIKAQLEVLNPTLEFIIK